MKRALLVIDLLNDFVRSGGVLECGENGRRAARAAARHIADARAAGEPVFYICDRHRADDAEFELFPPHCIAGSEGADIYDAVAPQDGDMIIPKRRFSGFFGTDLDGLLREAGVEEIALVGVCTNICVLYTAADARMRGYDVVVYRDAVASFDDQAHDAALRELQTTLKARIES